MKYFNQVNFALALIAAVAVVYAFSRTYFDPAEPPGIVVETPTAEKGSPAAPEAGIERGETPANPRLTQPRPGTALPGVRPPTPRSRSRGVQPDGASPAESRPAAAPLRPEAQAERPPAQRREAAGEQPDPNRRPAGGGLRPAPRRGQDEGEDEAEPAPPRSFPQTPEGARREQNRRGNPSPPPARSSMPEQRPR